MTPDEQKEFIRALADKIRDDIITQIDHGKIPDAWDGIELRLLLAYNGQAVARMCRSNKKRIRAFNNTVLVNNL